MITLTEPTLNRAQRRAMAKTRQPSRSSHHRRVDRFSGVNLLNRARPYEDGEMEPEHQITRESFARLRTGAGDEGDFDRVSMLMNVGMIRGEDIDPAIVAIMQTGMDAMNRMKARYLQGKSLAFDGAGLEAADYALETYETVMDNSSPLQMIHALREAYKRISNGDLLEMPA